MALFDFMKNRNASQQQAGANRPLEQKPETAKESHTRQAIQEKAAQKPLDRMPADQQAKVEAIKQRLENATRHISPAGSQAPIPADNNGGREAMRQNMTGQDKTAPALSPTSAQAGQPSTENNTPSRSKDAPAKTQEKGRTQQTVPRPRPSWER